MEMRMEDRHRQEISEQEAALNTRINQLEGRTLKEAKRAARLDQRIQELAKLKSDAAFMSKYDEDMRALTERHAVEKAGMSWCRYVLEQLTDPQDEDGAEAVAYYFEACQEQFRSIYGKLEKGTYKNEREFCQDVLDIYTTHGEQLGGLARTTLKYRFQGLIADRDEWKVKHGVEGAMDES